MLYTDPLVAIPYSTASGNVSFRGLVPAAFRRRVRAQIIAILRARPGILFRGSSAVELVCR